METLLILDILQMLILTPFLQIHISVAYYLVIVSPRCFLFMTYFHASPSSRPFHTTHYDYSRKFLSTHYTQVAPLRPEAPFELAGL
jgi:hypothetical protein